MEVQPMHCPSDGALPCWLGGKRAAVNCFGNRPEYPTKLNQEFMGECYLRSVILHGSTGLDNGATGANTRL